MFNEAAQGSALDARVRALSAENTALQQQIDQRTTQIGEAGNVDWLEGQARKLGFVFPGETLYIITSPGTTLPPTGGINATLPTFAPPTPTPSASATPSASPGASGSATPSAPASPTPLVFVMPTPTPTPH